MPKAPPKLSVETVVVCDDVRHEDTGKTILVGVYNHNIALKSFPSPAAFQVWVQLRVEGARKGKIPIGFRLLRDEKLLFRAKANIKINATKNKIIAFAFPTPVLEIMKPCQLKIGLQLPNKRNFQLES